VVRLRFASDEILCAAIFIGEIIAFEFDSFVESLKICNSGKLHNHYCSNQPSQSDVQVTGDLERCSFQPWADEEVTLTCGSISSNSYEFEFSGFLAESNRGPA